MFLLMTGVLHTNPPKISIAIISSFSEAYAVNPDPVNISKTLNKGNNPCIMPCKESGLLIFINAILSGYDFEFKILFRNKIDFSRIFPIKKFTES